MCCRCPQPPSDKLIWLTLARCTVCHVGHVGPGSSCHVAARDFPGKERCTTQVKKQEHIKSQVTQSPPTQLKDNQPCRPPKEAPFLSQQALNNTVFPKAVQHFDIDVWAANRGKLEEIPSWRLNPTRHIRNTQKQQKWSQSFNEAEGNQLEQVEQRWLPLSGRALTKYSCQWHFNQSSLSMTKTNHLIRTGGISAISGW